MQEEFCTLQKQYNILERTLSHNSAVFRNFFRGGGGGGARLRLLSRSKGGY